MIICAVEYSATPIFSTLLMVMRMSPQNRITFLLSVTSNCATCVRF